jgi:hypothetical protein
MNKLYLVGLFYFVACGDKDKDSPTVTITSHEDGVEVRDGFVEYFSAEVTDDDNGFDELNVAWYVGEELVCDWAVVNEAGESTCEIVFAVGDNAVLATVRDPQEAEGQSELSIDVVATYAPEIELLTPLADNKHYSNEPILFSALASDLEDASDNLIVSWTSSVDGELSLDTSIDADGKVSDYGFLTENSHTIELRVEDSTGKVSTEEVVIQVGGENIDPDCGFTAPSDEESFVMGDSIIFSGTAMDEDIPNDELTADISSNLDGTLHTFSPLSDGTFSFSSDALSVGTHTITLSVSDEAGGDCRTEMTLFITANNLPIVDSISLSPDPVYTDDNLSVTASGSDADGHTVTMTYVWYENSTETSITGTTVDASEIQVGETWTVQVTPNDGLENGNYLEEMITISNSNPTVTTPTISPSSNIYVNTLLTCSAT